MKNANSTGQTIQHVAAAALTAGVPFLQRDLLLVPLNDAAIGEAVTCYTGLHGGEYTFAAETGAGQDWEQGEKLYWDESESRFTVTASGNTFRGFAGATKASGTATGRVLLSQIAA